MFFSKALVATSVKSARIVHSFVAVLALFLVAALVVLGLPAAALPDDSTADPVSAVSSSAIMEPYRHPGQFSENSGSVTAVSSNASYESFMELTSLSPELIRPSDTVRVLLKVTNSLNSPIDEATVDFDLTRVRFTTRSGLDSWDARTLESAPGSLLSSETLEKPLAPGKTATFEFKVPASQFALLGGYEGWGPRGVRFELSGKVAGESVQLDAIDSFIIWYPAEDQVSPNLNVSTIVPVTGQTLDPLNVEAPTTPVLSQVGKDQSLSAILDAVTGNDHVALAVDPELIESIDIAARVSGASDDAQADETTAPSDSEVPVEPTIEQVDANNWLSSFSEATSSHEVLRLPAYDADWVSYLNAGIEVPGQSSVSSEVIKNVDFSGSVAWPTAKNFSSAVVQAASDSSVEVTVAEDGVLVDNPDDTFTRSGVLTLDGASRTSVFDSDEGLTELLQQPRSNSPVVERQRFIAELAVISKEQPSNERNIVVALERGWNPDSKTARAQLAAIPGLPWVETSPLVQTSAQEHARVDVAELPSIQANELFTQGEFPTLRNLQKELVRFSRVVEEPSVISGPHAQALTRLSSQYWFTAHASHTQAISQYTTSARQILGSITVVPSSDINLISTGAEIPVTVKNDLDQTVTLQVKLDPNDSRLQAADAIPATIPPHSTESIRIPVTAVGSGNVQVSVDLLDESGKHVTTSGSFDVRVRADWENVGTGVVITLLVFLLVGGIWRTVRRGRSSSRTEGLDVDDALAVVESDPEDQK